MLVICSVLKWRCLFKLVRDNGFFFFIENMLMLNKINDVDLCKEGSIYNNVLNV